MKVGDMATMRKPHACGSFDWEIVRVGADIGLRCLECGHRIMLQRTYFNKRVKKVTPKEE